MKTRLGFLLSLAVLTWGCGGSNDVTGITPVTPDPPATATPAGGSHLSPTPNPTPLPCLPYPKCLTTGNGGD